MGRESRLARKEQALRVERAKACHAAEQALSVGGILRSWNRSGAWVKAGLKTRVLRERLKEAATPKRFRRR